MVLVGGYGLPTLTLLNGYLGPAAHVDGRWHYWFIEVAVQLLLLATALLAIRPVRRATRSRSGSSSAASRSSPTAPEST